MDIFKSSSSLKVICTPPDHAALSQICLSAINSRHEMENGPICEIKSFKSNFLLKPLTFEVNYINDLGTMALLKGSVRI